MNKRTRKVKRPKTHPKISPVQHLKSAMASRRKSEAEISELRGMLTDKSARQVSLETTGDLDNAAVISEIGRLHVFAEMLPRRIAFKEKEDVKAEENLVRATNEFIQEHLGPRVRRLAAQTRLIVENELSSHIRERSVLIVAVSQSERVRTIERLAWAATLQPERGATVHAEGALQSWAAVDELEKTLASENV